MYVIVSYLMLLQILINTDATSTSSYDKESLRRAVEAANASLDDIAFEYEGHIKYHTVLAAERLKLDSSNIFISFSGTCVYRHDGALLMDAFVRTCPSNVVVKESISFLHGKRVHFRKETDKALGNVTITALKGHNTAQTTSPTLMFFLPAFRVLLDDEDTLVIDRGDEELATTVCRVVDLVSSTATASGKAYKPATMTGSRLWLDLRRGCQPLKREVYSSGKLISRATVSLEQVADKSGQLFWLPAWGETQGFVDADENGKIFYSRDPQNSEVNKMMMNTVKVNAGVADARFALSFKAGTPISDNLSSLRYQFGQQPAKKLVTRQQAEDDLKSILKAAQRQKDELEAPSLERQGGGVASLVPWIVSIVSVAVLAIVYVRNHWKRS